ncbi:MAG: GIY-YIG nuclease family protein [Acidobacteria bacterium]|nr:GIY-YIG nuclease family protein [Acidobacteriota bacterium]
MSTEPKRFVYVLESTRVHGRHYVGLTSNVTNRLAAHNNGRALHSTKYGPWRVTAVVEFASKSLAAKFERYLKSGSGRAFARRHFAE